MLASGLPEIIADDEDIARYLTSSGQFNTRMAKPAAFLPSTRDRETSVFRHGSEPRDVLWRIGEEHVGRGERKIYGAAVVKAGYIRAALLQLDADEPPPRHGVIRGWPWIDDDPELQKAQQKERAALFASKAELLLQR
jgi:hypothetical protein